MEQEEPKTQKDQVRRWLDRVNVAKRYRDRIFDDMGVDRYVKGYEGDYDIRLGNINAPPINEIFAYVSTLCAILNFRNPSIAVNPKKSGSIKGARILEQCLAYDWRVLKIKDENDMELIDCPLSGIAWHKTAYWAETLGKGGEVTGLKDEGIYSNRVSFRDIVFNIGARRIPADCQWIAHRIVKPTNEAKKMFPGNPELPGGPHPSLNKNELKWATYKDDLNYTIMWEIWSMMDKKLFIVAENYDEKFLKKPVDWPDYMDSYPFDPLIFNVRPDEAFPIPDIKLIEPQIIETIKLVAMMLNHVKRWNRMLIIKKGAIDPMEQDKLEKGVDGTILEANGNPAEVAQPLVYGPVPQDIYAILNKLDEIKNRIGGLTNTSMGGTDITKTRTMGELNLMQQGSGQRTDKKRDKFERHLESIARKLIAIRQKNFDLEQVVKITGQQPQEVIQAFQDQYDPQTRTITFTKEDIQGEYEIDVQAGSTLPMDKVARMGVLERVIEQGAKLAQLPSLPPFLAVAISEILKDFEIKSLEDAFNAQTRQADIQSMQQAQKDQVDQAKIQAETAKREAQAQQIKTDTTITGADALIKAHQLGVLPEVIAFGRAAGSLPSGGNAGPTPPQFPGGQP